MNRQQLEDFVYESYMRRNGITLRKNRDYARDDDVLANFKRVAQICKILHTDVTTPAGYAELCIIEKLDRYCNLVHQNRKPNYEAIEDTLDDLQNYTDLLQAIRKEGDALNELEQLEKWLKDKLPDTDLALRLLTYWRELYDIENNSEFRGETT